MYISSTGHADHDQDVAAGTAGRRSFGSQPVCERWLMMPMLPDALGRSPRYDAEVRDQLRRDVVHHQREQRLVGVPLCLEEGGGMPPQIAPASMLRQEHHAGSARSSAARRAGVIMHAGGGEAAHQGLTLGADVPKAHLERGGNGRGRYTAASLRRGWSPTSCGGRCRTRLLMIVL